MTWWQILIFLLVIGGVLGDIVSTICDTIKDIKQTEMAFKYIDFYDDEESEEDGEEV